MLGGSPGINMDENITENMDKNVEIGELSLNFYMI